MSQSVKRLADIIQRLRDPKTGCPWDVKQNFKTIAPCTLEEAYEVVEAIENDDSKALKEELGDLLLQVVFHSQMASEQNLFTLDDVAETVSNKMVERHPHVFGDAQAHTAEEVLKGWFAGKDAKRKQQAEAENRPYSVLDSINTALPAIDRAGKIQKAVARIGFDWLDLTAVIDKVDEEIQELKNEITSQTNDPSFVPNRKKQQEELGDVFFALVNLARHLKIDPETALRECNRKFDRRFRGVEKRLKDLGIQGHEADLATMESLWQDVKKEEKGG